VVAATGQAIRGVGQRYFSERLPNPRIATDDGRPAAHLRQLSGIVSPEPARELRCLRRAVGRARGERRGICDLPGGLPSAWVVPVPLHRQRKQERGFNLVEPFARPLERRLGIPYRPVLLMRTRPRPEKHLLD